MRENVPRKSRAAAAAKNENVSKQKGSVRKNALFFRIKKQTNVRKNIEKWSGV
jgi:hypothetical protein